MNERLTTPRIKKGDIVFWKDPSEKQGYEHTSGQRTVTARYPHMLVLDDATEALHSECYLKAPYVCPICGRRLYYEKSYNTTKKYPLVCFGCDENFFYFEAKPGLSYGHISELEGIFDSTFNILAEDKEEGKEIYTQALGAFISEWESGGIMDQFEFYDIYGSNGLILKADSWWSGTDFETMQFVTGIRQNDYSPEDGYQEFIDACEARWKVLSHEDRHDIYKRLTK